MQLTVLDWGIIVGYGLLALGLGIGFARRASGSLTAFFLSGRSLPWWLGGTSIVATTFAADTPLAVTGLVREQGIAGNWFWWNVALSGTLATFLYARLWRRAGILTDIELIELRYAGRPAAALRGVSAVYFGAVTNCITMGWVILAMAKILGVALGWPKEASLAVLMLVALSYSILAGLWGVVITDLIQFVMAVTGSIALAWFALEAVGGMGGLVEGLERTQPSAEALLAFFPATGSAWMPATTFAVYLGVIWWARFHADGGGYIAQRLFASRDERQAVFASLWFNVAHYALRPWPWILAALASLVLYPELADPETAYPKMIVALLPSGLRGLMIASLLAAFMSTIDTHLNWGASYLVNDVYLRFWRRGASEAESVRVSRMAMGLLLVGAALTAYLMTSIVGAWKFLTAVGGGTGLVFLLRWYWWRINAWSEIAALAASFAITVGLTLWTKLDFAGQMLVVVPASTAVWLGVTFATSPVAFERLEAFYRQVRPHARLWGPVAESVGPVEGEGRGAQDLWHWLLGAVGIYAAMIGIGKLLLGHPALGISLCALAAGAFFVILRDLTPPPDLLPAGREGEKRVNP